MKKAILFLFLLNALVLYSQPVDRTFQRGDGSINILGQASLDRLKSSPFDDWFKKSYEAYDVDVETVKTLKMPDSITLFMGTWCGDSKREVPRFVKILEEAAFDLAKLRVICLDAGFQNYKQAPEREEAGQNIHRVPTFIFHDEEQVEIGRIVEEPVVSLESDLKLIMEGGEYHTFYPVANDLIKNVNETPVKKLGKEKSALAKKYKSLSVSEYELNTYGYVLWASFQLPEAEFIFELNTMLYPDSVTPYRTLASFKSTLGKRKAALDNIKKGLKLDPKNETLLAMQASLTD